MINVEITFKCDLGDGTVATASATPLPNAAMPIVLPTGWRTATLNIPGTAVSIALICPNHIGSSFFVCERVINPLDILSTQTPNLGGS